MSEPYLASIIMFAGNFAPRGWAFCNGQILSISTNTALFSLLGTTYGGNGQTTFALPDLRSRVPLHSGNGSAGVGLSSYQLGQMSGVESVTLSASQMPIHNHLLSASSAAADQSSPIGAIPAIAAQGSGRTATQLPMYTQAAGSGQMAATMVTTAGSGQAHINVQPILGLNFIIALQGVFPSRN